MITVLTSSMFKTSRTSNLIVFVNRRFNSVIRLILVMKLRQNVVKKSHMKLCF